MLKNLHKELDQERREEELDAERKVKHGKFYAGRRSV